MELPDLGKVLGKAPIPHFVLLFGGIFVAVSITSNSEYIFESFLTFIYGVVSSYVRIIRKDEKLGYWLYFIIQSLFFILWAVLVGKGVQS